MLSAFQNCLVVILTVVASMAFLVVLDRIWPWEERHAHNDVTGWQLSILGTTYAVIMGFMLYAVWTDFVTATYNADLEANNIVNIYRFSEGLPEPQHADVQRLVRSYAVAAVERDWPEMAQDQIPLETTRITQNLWKTLMSIKDGSRSETLAQDHALSELSALASHRRTRVLESNSRLPVILWFVLIVGGILSVVSSCLFGSPNRFLHVLQVLFFSLLISLVLLAIADINRPYQGSVHVNDDAFRRAQDNMR